MKIKKIFLVLPVPRFDKNVFYPRGKRYLDIFIKLKIKKIYIIIWNNDGKQDFTKFCDMDIVNIFKASKRICRRGEFSKDYLFSYFSFLLESKKFLIKYFNPNTDIIILNKQYSLPLLNYLLGKINAKNVFLDISDIHSLDYKYKRAIHYFLAYKVINYLENKITNKLSGLIVSSSGFSNYYFKKGIKENIFEFENIPDFYKVDKLENDDFGYNGKVDIGRPKIGFVGKFRHYKNYLPIIKLAHEREIYFFVFGIDLHNQLKITREIHFYGEYTYKYEELRKIYSSFDITAIIYPDIGNHKYALPNKLYESIFFKKPILASKGTYLGKIVEDYRIGEVVELNKPDTYKLKIDKIIKNYQNYLDNIEKIRDKYDYHKIKNQLISFIEERINKNNNTLGHIVEKKD